MAFFEFSAHEIESLTQLVDRLSAQELEVRQEEHRLYFAHRDAVIKRDSITDAVAGLEISLTRNELISATEIEILTQILDRLKAQELEAQSEAESLRILCKEADERRGAIGATIADLEPAFRLTASEKPE